MNIRVILFVLLSGFVPFVAFPHPGGIDANSGHWNRKVGEYHYHNKGSDNHSIIDSLIKNVDWKRGGEALAKEIGEATRPPPEQQSVEPKKKSFGIDEGTKEFLGDSIRVFGPLVLFISLILFIKALWKKAFSTLPKGLIIVNLLLWLLVAFALALCFVKLILILIFVPLLVLSVGFRLGYNWARVLYTLLCILFLLCVLLNPSLLILSPLLLFLVVAPWLPKSNAWFRSKKATRLQKCSYVGRRKC